MGSEKVTPARTGCLVKPKGNDGFDRRTLRRTLSATDDTSVLKGEQSLCGFSSRRASSFPCWHPRNCERVLRSADEYSGSRSPAEYTEPFRSTENASEGR